MSFLMLLQIPLKFWQMCKNSPVIISGTPQFFIRHVNNAGGRWNCLCTLTSRLTGRQGRCGLKVVLYSQVSSAKLTLWWSSKLCCTLCCWCSYCSYCWCSWCCTVSTWHQPTVLQHTHNIHPCHLSLCLLVLCGPAAWSAAPALAQSALGSALLITDG